jgi:hypothetical protein
MSDPRLGMQFRVVKDGNPGGLTAGSSCGGNGNEGSQLARYRPGSSDGRVDIVEEVRGARSIQVGNLRGVHSGATTYRHIAVETAVGGKSDGVLEGQVVGLDAHTIEESGVDPLGPEGREDDGHGFRGSELGVGDYHDPSRPQILHVRSHLAGGAAPELDA